MTYVPNVISTILFESDNVITFKIPPGDKWNLSPTNIIWQGKLQLIEQESIPEEEGDNITKPFDGLRAKIELYNSLPSGNQAWAEVWYNPHCQFESEVSLANNGQETIQMKDSSRYYKVIAQLPGAGYHPLRNDIDNDNQVKLQVALGLKFQDHFSAIMFQESLSIYKRRFKNYEDQYQSDINQKIHHVPKSSIINQISELKIDPDVDADENENENDDFGDFVTS